MNTMNNTDLEIKLYYAWSSMKQRCTNKKKSNYYRYGGRGIIFCNEWVKYKNFRVWALSSGYKDGLSLDRIDNDGNYEPSNCRWATMREQQSHTSMSKLITYNSDAKCMSEWARFLGMSSNGLKYRIFIGKWSLERALNEKVNFKILKSEAEKALLEGEVVGK
jgi:hypothetical protein